MKFISKRNTRSAFLASLLLAVAGSALAAAGTAGGLTVATTTASTIQTALFTFVGAIAGSYLLYTGIMAWTDKKTWGDFGMAVVYVSLVGGAIALATWAWALFQ